MMNAKSWAACPQWKKISVASALRNVSGTEIYNRLEGFMIKECDFDHFRQKKNDVPFLSAKLRAGFLLVGLHVLRCRFHFFCDYFFFHELILIISCQTLQLLMFHVKKTTLPFFVNLYKIPVKCCFLPLYEGVTLGFLFPFLTLFVLHSIFKQEKTQ